MEKGCILWVRSLFMLLNAELTTKVYWRSIMHSRYIVCFAFIQVPELCLSSVNALALLIKHKDQICRNDIRAVTNNQSLIPSDTDFLLVCLWGRVPVGQRKVIAREGFKIYKWYTSNILTVGNLLNQCGWRCTHFQHITLTQLIINAPDSQPPGFKTFFPPVAFI